jgi:transcription antitermination factor NusG
MHPSPTGLVAGAFAACLFGCQPDAQKSQELLKAQAELKQANQALGEKIDKLEGEIKRLDAQVALVGSKQSRVASVSAADEGYAVAVTRLGPFTVLFDRATQYLDGYRVRLKIRNLGSAIAVGARLKIQWGPEERFPRAKEKGAPLLQREKEVTIERRLYPGYVYPVEVVLSPATAVDVKTLRIEIDTDRIEARRRSTNGQP